MNATSNENDVTIPHPTTSNQAEGTFIKSAIPDDKTVIGTVVEAKPMNGVTEGVRVGSILQNRYVIKDALGSGGMGVVFRATDMRREEAQDQQPDVAIKVLGDGFRDDPELFIALQRETKKTQLLAHPNIVTVYDFDKDGNNVFMVMELLEGKTLAQFIKEESASGGLSFKEAWHIIEGLALALAYAHKKNIIHSDFKPGNVFITTEGDVKVFDFGIACAAVQSDRQHDDTVFNARDLGALTLAYASLEMLQRKEPSPADDVYALACVCFELLSGKHPFGRLSAQKAFDLELEIPVIKGLDRRVRLALTHALAIRREQRTATINVFIHEIKPKSIWPKVFGGMAIITALSIAASGYYVTYEMTFVDDEMIALTPEQKLKIDDFLELAQIHFDVGYLAAPSGSNAIWAYRQVLDVDPYNQDAQEGLKKIADLVEQQAADLFVSGQNKASLAKIEDGLGAVPKHEELLELKERILRSGIGTH